MVCEVRKKGKIILTTGMVDSCGGEPGFAGGPPPRGGGGRLDGQGSEEHAGNAGGSGDEVRAHAEEVRALGEADRAEEGEGSAREEETRRRGVRPFGLTIDARAQAQFPLLFGRGGFAVVSDPARLPAAMPILLRRLSAGSGA